MVDRSPTARLRRRARRWRQRGVSEVIGTILVLAIAMALIAAVFLFVLRSPAPTVNPAANFTVGLVRNTTYLTNVSIQYLVGPTISGSTTSLASVHIASAAKPSVLTASFSLSAGHLSPANSWKPGQSWWMSLATYHLPASDNLTIEVYSSGKLLFSQVAPGPHVLIAPYFTSVWTNPTVLYHGTNYTILATIMIPNGLGGTGTVTVDVSQANGPASLQTMKTATSSGVVYWYYNVTSTPTSAGTFNVILHVTDSQGETNAIVKALTFG